VAGTTVANSVSERVLELSFAALQLGFAASMLKRALTPRNNE
jgi:hypothetical protein